MPDRFECYTLFDITKTGVLNRSRPREDADIHDWVRKRDTQCNFDTILQAISLRSQPENITTPQKSVLDPDTIKYFGFMYELPDSKSYFWKFTFDVQHAGVFDSEEKELGFLYRDVDDIPMILIGTELPHVPPCLDTTPESKNIHFVRIKGD